MKKGILLLTVLMLILTACQSEDDNANDSSDQLIGTWNLFMEIENNVEQELDPCDTEEIFIILADGTYTRIDYLENNGSCVEENVTVGTWSNDGNNNYAFSDDGYGYPITENITFEGNTFYFVGIYNNGNGDITYRDVWLRSN